MILCKHVTTLSMYHYCNNSCGGMRSNWSAPSIGLIEGHLSFTKTTRSARVNRSLVHSQVYLLTLPFNGQLSKHINVSSLNADVFPREWGAVHQLTTAANAEPSRNCLPPSWSQSYSPTRNKRHWLVLPLGTLTPKVLYVPSILVESLGTKTWVLNAVPLHRRQSSQWHTIFFHEDEMGWKTCKMVVRALKEGSASMDNIDPPQRQRPSWGMIFLRLWGRSCEALLGK